MDSFRASTQLLRRLPPFSSLTTAQWAALAPGVQQRSYAKRDVIHNAGDPATGVYVVLVGQVSTVYTDANAHEFIAEVIGANRIVGEIALLGSKPWPCSVRAESDCELLFVPRCTLERCLAENPVAAAAMLRVVLAHLCGSHRRLAHVALTTVYERVAMVVLENSEETEAGCMLEVGAEQIARLVGSSREMVTRVVNRMIRDGVVARAGHGKLVLTDREALVRMVAKPHVPPVLPQGAAATVIQAAAK